MAKNNRAREIIIATLQQMLAGKVYTYSNFSPQKTADTILTQISFEKPYNEIQNDRFISAFTDTIVNLKNEMTLELDKLPSEEKLLRNFVQGKINAYDEILDTIKVCENGIL